MDSPMWRYLDGFKAYVEPSHLSKSGYCGALTYKMVKSQWLPIVVWP